MSPYSAKTRAYLRFKGIPFDDIPPTAGQLFRTIRRAVGRPVMPTVRTPDGEWLQDSSDIIDALEQRVPEPSITPPGAAQRVASLLLELHGDEWLPIVAMHTRWNLPENAAFARDEFARNGFPRLPAFIGRRLASRIVKKMRGYLPILGIRPGTRAGVDAYATRLIEILERHLQEHPFLLGGRPCIGDFALFGPLWAHVFRDPASTARFDDAPAVRAWFDRLLTPPTGVGGFLAGDEVPATLDPLFELLFREQFAYILALADAIERYCDAHPEATRVPRSLGDHDFIIGGHAGTRRLITFSWWMAQRPLDAYQEASEADHPTVDAWLERVGGLAAMRRPIRRRFVRREFKMALETGAGDVTAPAA